MRTPNNQWYCQAIILLYQVSLSPSCWRQYLHNTHNWTQGSQLVSTRSLHPSEVFIVHDTGSYSACCWRRKVDTNAESRISSDGLLARCTSTISGQSCGATGQYLIRWKPISHQELRNPSLKLLGVQEPETRQSGASERTKRPNQMFC